MDTEKRKWLSCLLEDEDMEEIKHQVSNMNDSVLLHIVAGNYNWDNGLEIPKVIVSNKNCDLGTAFMIFHHADGYSMFDLAVEDVTDSFKVWYDFVLFVYDKITNDEFKLKNISFVPPLTKVQMYRLIKRKPDMSNLFLEGSLGMDLEIPLL